MILWGGVLLFPKAWRSRQDENAKLYTKTTANFFKVEYQHHPLKTLSLRGTDAGIIGFGPFLAVVGRVRDFHVSVLPLSFSDLSVGRIDVIFTTLCMKVDTMTPPTPPVRRSIYPHLFDSDYPEEPILSKLSDAAEEVEKEFQFLNLVFHIGNIGAWEQLDEIELYVTKAWLRIFGQKCNATSLEDYLVLIDDPIDRDRVREARENLVFQAAGTKWNDEYSVCGKRIQSTAFVTTEQTVIGVDVILNNQPSR